MNHKKSSSSLQEFSRAVRSRDYWLDAATTSRGRKRKKSLQDASPQSSLSSKATTPLKEPQCFQVRDMPQKGGIGVISTRKIKSGEVLVSEFPLLCVGVPGASSNVVCETCLTPLGSLRVQLEGVSKKLPTSNNNENEALPLLDPEDDDGPKFASICHERRSCSSCGTMWCSDNCRDSNKILHDLLLCCGESHSTNMNKESEDTPKSKHQEAQFQFRTHAIQAGLEFLLVGQAIGKMIATVMKDTKIQAESSCLMDDDPNFYWWREYAHPLWWDLSSGSEGDDKDDRIKRKELCKTSHGLLLQALQTSLSHMMNGNSGEKKTFLLSMIEKLCTLDNFGEILGMLQCNVMEVEFPSPNQQYVAHLEGILEENGDEGEEENSNNQEEGYTEFMEMKNHLKSWLANYFSMDIGKSTKESTVESESMENMQQEGPTPIVGSGLFPILTLANHDCDPNASIEFLGESNKGSLVALRSIALGEEITITYTPNGDFDCGDEEGCRFEHFQPTRTWLYLNKSNDCDNSDTGANSDIECESNSEQVDELPTSNANTCIERPIASSHDEKIDNKSEYADDGCDEGNKNDDSSDIAEGLLWTERARVLTGYGFSCRCARCQHEKLDEKTPYCREKRNSLVL